MTARNIIGLLALVVIALGGVSLWLGQDMNWDLSYDPAVATLGQPKVVQGNVPMIEFRANPQDRLIRMGFTQKPPINNDGTVAYVETEPWTFEVRPVEIAFQQGNEAIIKSGLKAGERVVVKGGVLLND